MIVAESFNLVLSTDLPPENGLIFNQFNQQYQFLEGNWVEERSQKNFTVCP